MMNLILMSWVLFSDDSEDDVHRPNTVTFETHYNVFQIDKQTNATTTRGMYDI